MLYYSVCISVFPWVSVYDFSDETKYFYFILLQSVFLQFDFWHAQK